MNLRRERIIFTDIKLRSFVVQWCCLCVTSRTFIRHGVGRFPHPWVYVHAEN
jgi:hypothetical protein